MPNLELVRKDDVSSFRKIAIGTWRTAYDPSVYGTVELRMDKAEMKDVTIAGSKMSRLTMQGGSLLKSTKFAGSTLTGLTLEEGSRMEDSRLAGCTSANGFTLAQGSEIKDCRFNGMSARTLLPRCFISPCSFVKAV